MRRTPWGVSLRAGGLAAAGGVPERVGASTKPELMFHDCMRDRPPSAFCTRAAGGSAGIHAEKVKYAKRNVKIFLFFFANLEQIENRKLP